MSRCWYVLTLLSAALLAGCGDRSAPAAGSAVAAADKPAAVAKEAKKDEGKDEHGHEEEGHGGGGHGNEGGAIEMSAEEIKAAGIRTERIDWSAGGGEIVVTGVVQPNADRLAQTAPRVPGRVVSTQVSLGDRVKGGQTLALLDSLEIGEARAALAQAEAELKVADSAFKRAASLRDEQIVPEKEYLRARGDSEKANGTVVAAREKLKMLGVSANSPGESPSMFPLVSPFAGTIVEKTAVPGALADASKPLFTVADLSVVWIEANVFEADLPRLARGAAAAVTVAAWPGSPVKGRLTFISPLMDKETRTVKARVEVPNGDGRLRPGMFANVAIAAATGAAEKLLLVPEDAVVLMDGKPSVFIKGDHGFETRAVTTGERRVGRIALKDGVSPKDEVVVSGAYELKARATKSQLGAGHAH